VAEEAILERPHQPVRAALAALVAAEVQIQHLHGQVTMETPTQAAAVGVVVFLHPVPALHLAQAAQVSSS